MYQFSAMNLWSLPVSIASEVSGRKLSERLWRRHARRRPARAVLSWLLLGADAARLGGRRDEPSLDAHSHDIGFGRESFGCRTIPQVLIGSNAAGMRFGQNQRHLL